MTAEQLRSILEEVIHDPKFQPRDGTTFCNLAVQKVCNAFDIYDFDGMIANEMIDALEKNMLKGWRPCGGEKASEHALIGGLAIAGKRGGDHGHVAVVWPGSMDYSPNYGKMVPMLANVGEKNGIISMSWAFASKRGEPGYWKYQEA